MYLSVFLNLMFRVSYFSDDTQDPKSFSELHARGLNKARLKAPSHPVPVVSEDCEQGDRLPLQFQKKLRFQRKQMRERAFAERCAERRALAGAKALEIAMDETSFTEMACEDLVKYEACTQAPKITIGESAVDVVTDMVCQDLKKCDDLETYEDHAETPEDTKITEKNKHEEGGEDMVKHQACTEAPNITVGDTVMDVATELAVKNSADASSARPDVAALSFGFDMSEYLLRKVAR